MRHRRRRSEFGWDESHHAEIAAERLEAAERHVEAVFRNANNGFCLTALEALTWAADALGAAAHGFNAAGQAPGAKPGFNRVYKSFVDARKHVGRTCLKGG